VTATARTTAADALRNCALFSRVDDATLGVCIDSLRSRRYRRNETIFHQATRGIPSNIIDSGAVKIVLPSPEGEEEAIIATLGPGDFFGELALLDGAERSATAIAHEATTALVLRRDAFGLLIDTVPRCATSCWRAWWPSCAGSPITWRSCTSWTLARPAGAPNRPPGPRRSTRTRSGP